MALIKCPECGKEVSDKAGKCPNCGCILEREKGMKVEKKEQKKSNKIVLLIVGIVGGFILGVLIGYSISKENNESTIVDNNTSMTNTIEDDKAVESNTVKEKEIKKKEIVEAKVGEAMEIHHEYGTYTLTVERVRKSDWLQRSNKDDGTNCVVLMECDIKNESYEDPYNDHMYIDNQIIALDQNNYTLKKWSMGYNDGVYSLTPTIPAGTNGKIVIPYLVNIDCSDLTLTFNDEYKVIAHIEE